MSESKRPWPVIVISSLYLLVGVIGFVAHFQELWARHPDAVAIELTELVGAISGAGLLMRQKWARWLALAWILFHVGLSLFHPLGELAMRTRRMTAGAARFSERIRQEGRPPVVEQ